MMYTDVFSLDQKMMVTTSC